MAFSDGVVAERLWARVASWTYLPLLGIKPVLGRPFAAADGRTGSPPVVIVSHGFWQRRLAAHADILGTPVRLNGEDHLVVGVLPSVVGPLEQQLDFLVAARWEPPRRKGPFFLTVLGRLRPQSGHDTASAELRGINRRIFPVWQASYQDTKASWAMTDLKTHVVGDIRPVAGLALGAVGLVWLLACTNASNLLIARVTGRRRELAVRVALGASAPAHRAVPVGRERSAGHGRGRRRDCAGLGRRAASPQRGCALLSACGRDHARWDRAVAAGRPDRRKRHPVRPDPRPPRERRTGRRVAANAGRSTTGHRGVRSLRRLLVGGQFAIATPLLVIAGLLLASLNELKRVDVGFDTHNLLTGSILLPAAQYRGAGPG